MLVEERNRIEGCGGKVVNGRVNGALAVARSFGDVEFKVCRDRPFPPERLRYIFSCLFLFKVFKSCRSSHR
jgi:hypothetical protein